jgi:hypothetical protein
MQRPSPNSIFIALIVTLLSSIAQSQSQTAIVQGQVVNTSGTAVPDAMLQWSAVGVAGSGTDYSDSQGNFAFAVPLASGSVQVQISLVANAFVSKQVSVQAQGGQTTSVQIMVQSKPPNEFATVSGTLEDSNTHQGIPSAQMQIFGAGGILTSLTDSNGKFSISGVGFNTALTLQAETLEYPCIATSTFPLSVATRKVKMKLLAQTLIIETPHCADNQGMSHNDQDQAEAPQIGIDDTLQWKQADTMSISTNSSANAWNAGRVNDILRGPAGTGLVVASDEGGVWLTAENAVRTSIPVGDTWSTITMSSLAYGPGGAGDVYGGTYDAPPSSPGYVLWETDTSSGFPLLNWYPVHDAPPCATIQKMLVIPEVGRIVLACNNGLFWSQIPPSPSVFNTYTWHQATPTAIASKPFSGVAKGTGWIVGSGHEGTIVATMNGGAAPKKLIYTAKWQNGNLVLKAATVAITGGTSFGRTSVAACPKNPNSMFALAADQNNDHIGGVWETTDGGFHWSSRTIPSSSGDQQGFYNNAIAVASDCSSIAMGWQTGTWLSFDNAGSWMHIEDSAGHQHADVHALTYDPADPSVLFIGSDGGVISASGIAPNVQPTLESDWSDELLNLEFNPGAASTSFAGLVTGAAQDNGALWADVPTGPWQHISDCGCDGGQSLFATPPGLPPTDDLLIEREWGEPNWPLDSVEAVGGFVPHGQQKNIYIDHDSDTVNDGVAQAVRSPGGFVNGSGEPMIAVNGDWSDNTLYGLFSMPDGSDLHWEIIGQLGGTDPLTAVAPSFDGSSVFVGTKGGSIYRFSAPYTSTGLQLNVSPPQVGAASVSGLYAFFSSVAWASYNVGNNGYVMFWNGSTWSASGLGMLPNSLPFNSITAKDLNTIFVSSSSAVYDTRDAGVGWSYANVGLPKNITHDPQLYFLPSSASGPANLYLTTWGRSLWVSPIK